MVDSRPLVVLSTEGSSPRPRLLGLNVLLQQNFGTETGVAVGFLVLNNIGLTNQNHSDLKVFDMFERIPYL